MGCVVIRNSSVVAERGSRLKKKIYLAANFEIRNENIYFGCNFFLDTRRTGIPFRLRYLWVDSLYKQDINEATHPVSHSTEKL